ncbi:MAG: ABC transporter permease [Firmicutes bacterium]|nr:ABC transporter permease [Bacillota bacterium]
MIALISTALGILAKKLLGERAVTLGRLNVLVKRNMKLFFKNKATVFFSFLAPILIFLLYTLFLSDTLTTPFLEQLGIEADAIGDRALDAVKTAWMVAGVISMAVFTIALNSTLVMVEDKEKRAIGDFIASPIKPNMLLTSYFISAFLVTFLLCLGVLVLGFTYLGIFTGLTLSIVDFFAMVGTLALSCLAAVAFMLCIMSFFKSNAGTTAFTGVFVALIGFLIGAYIPAGMIPNDVIPSLMGLIPGSHTSALFRQQLINRTAYTVGFHNETMSTINQFFSLEIQWFGFIVPNYLMYIYLVLSAILFSVLFFFINSFLRKRGRRN